MSDAQRRMVESVIKGLAGGEGSRQNTAAGSPDLSGTAALAHLLSLGFESDDIHQALASVASGSQASLPELLDWLCLNLPEDHLPTSLTPGKPRLASPGQAWL